MRRVIYLILITFFLFFAAEPALAQSPDPDDAPPQEVALTDEDAEIQRRLSMVFDELQGLEGVSVVVRGGVVTLSGEAPSDAQAATALSLAAQPDGVVTVEDEIVRTLDVRTNVTPVVQQYIANVKGLIKRSPLLLLALLVIIIFWMIGTFFRRRRGLWNRLTPSPFLAEILAQITRIAFLIFGVVIALDILGATALLATILGGAGVLGIAIGFAVRDTMENYIASIMLSLRQPFRAKDYVEINGQGGTVVRLTSRATILMTADGNHLRIPNAEVFKGKILNYSTNPERRFSFQLGVDSADDPIDAMKAGLDTLKSLEFVLNEPAPAALICDVGDSNILIEYRAWINQTETGYMKARSLAIRAVMIVLEEKGFTLPEPIYRLRFDPGVEGALEHGLTKDMKGSVPEPSRLKDQVERKAYRPTSVEELTDVTPDTEIQDKVEKEIQAQENDLLDEKRPTE